MEASQVDLQVGTPAIAFGIRKFEIEVITPDNFKVLDESDDDEDVPPPPQEVRINDQIINKVLIILIN